MRTTALTSATLAAVLALPGAALAVDATWLNTPFSGSYNSGANWTGGAAPVNQGDTATFGISGTTALNIGAAVEVDSWTFDSDASDYTFSVNNDLGFFAEGIVVNGGTQTLNIGAGTDLRFFNGSSTGQAVVNNAGTLRFYDNSTADNAAINTDSTITFSDTSTAGSAGLLGLNGSQIGFGDQSTAGSAQFMINTGGQLLFSAMSDAQDATIVNEGSVRFVGAATAGNAVITNNNMLILMGNATLGNARLLNNAGATTDLNGLDIGVISVGSIQGAGALQLGNTVLDVGGNDMSTTYSGTISGVGGSLNKVGAGTLVLTGANSYSGGTSVTEGTLVGNTTSLQGDIVNNAHLVFNGPDAGLHIFAGDITGTGEVTVTGSGALVLTGTNSYSGGTVIAPAGGTLIGNTTSLQGDIANFANLTFDQATDGTYTGHISGTGNFTKEGAGTLFLAGGHNYTGNTFLNAGSLIVNGSIAASNVTVANGGTLGGFGTVGMVNVNSGGAVAPGINSIGTMNASGIIFDAGSTYEVEVNFTGQSDRINATGVATINGGTVEIVPSPGFVRNTPYTILTAAGGVAGTFDDITFASPSYFITPVLSYVGNDVVLTLRQVNDFAGVVLTRNQIATAGGLQSLGADALPGRIAVEDGMQLLSESALLSRTATIEDVQSPGGGELFNAILLLGTADEARAALDAVSGKVHASAKTVLLEDSRFAREAALDRLRNALGGAGANAGQATQETPEGATLWAQGFGAWSRWNGDGNATEMSRNIGGLLMGADAEVLDSLTLGLMGGYSRSGLNVADRMSSGTVDSYTLGAYAGGNWNAFSLKGGAAYSWNHLDTSRTVAFTGFSDSLSASYNARAFQAYTEAAYSIEVGKARFEPFANFAYVNLDTDGFTETGGAAALSANGQSSNTAFATLGIRGEAQVDFGGMGATLSGGLGWRHAFGDTPTATHSFAAGGSAFTVAGVPLARDALVLDAGFNVNLTDNATISLSYNGQLGSGLADHSVKASLGIRF